MAPATIKAKRYGYTRDLQAVAGPRGLKVLRLNPSLRLALWQSLLPWETWFPTNEPILKRKVPVMRGHLKKRGQVQDTIHQGA